MTRDECVEIGYVAKAHSLKGEVKAVFDVYDIEEYGKGTILYLAKKNAPLIGRKILQINFLNEKNAIIAFEGITNRNMSEDLRGSTMYFPEANLPELPEGHYYYFEIIGFDVVDEKKGRLGKVKDIADSSAQDILMMEYKGKEVLIPMTDEFVGTANKELKEIYTNMPDGLLELYLGEGE